MRVIGMAVFKRRLSVVSEPLSVAAPRKGYCA